MFKVPEQFRIKHGYLASTADIGKNGGFRILFRSFELLAIATEKWADWEHVSVSLKHRCPNWEEMCMIKDLFLGQRGLGGAIPSS